MRAQLTHVLSAMSGTDRRSSCRDCSFQAKRAFLLDQMCASLRRCSVRYCSFFRDATTMDIHVVRSQETVDVTTRKVHWGAKTRTRTKELRQVLETSHYDKQRVAKLSNDWKSAEDLAKEPLSTRKDNCTTSTLV